MLEDHKVLEVHKDLKVIKATLEYRDHREKKATKVLLEKEVFKVHKENRAYKVYREYKEKRAILLHMMILLLNN